MFRSKSNNGIFKDTQGKYAVCVQICGRTKYLGAYATKKEAIEILYNAQSGKRANRWVQYY
jgi:hypothetical protein